MINIDKKVIEFNKQYLVQTPFPSTQKIHDYLKQAWFRVFGSYHSFAYKQSIRIWKPGNIWENWHLTPDNRLFTYIVNFHKPMSGVPSVIKHPKIVNQGITAKNWYYKKKKEIEDFYKSINNDSIVENTFCNISFTTFLAYYGAIETVKRIMKDSVNANIMIQNIKDKKYNNINNEGSFIPLNNAEEAIEYSKLGFLVVAGKKETKIGHLSIVFGEGTHTDKYGKSNKWTEKIPYVLNRGPSHPTNRDGYQSILFAFFINNVEEVDYFLYVPTYEMLDKRNKNIQPILN